MNSPSSARTGKSTNATSTHTAVRRVNEAWYGSTFGLIVVVIASLLLRQRPPRRVSRRGGKTERMGNERTFNSLLSCFPSSPACPLSGRTPLFHFDDAAHAVMREAAELETHHRVGAGSIEAHAEAVDVARHRLRLREQ